MGPTTLLEGIVPSANFAVLVHTEESSAQNLGSFQNGAGHFPQSLMNLGPPNVTGFAKVDEEVTGIPPFLQPATLESLETPAPTTSRSKGPPQPDQHPPRRLRSLFIHFQAEILSLGAKDSASHCPHGGTSPEIPPGPSPQQSPPADMPTLEQHTTHESSVVPAPLRSIDLRNTEDSSTHPIIKQYQPLTSPTKLTKSVDFTKFAGLAHSPQASDHPANDFPLAIDPKSQFFSAARPIPSLPPTNHTL